MKTAFKVPLLGGLFLNVLVALTPTSRLGAQTLEFLCNLSPWDAGPADLLLSSNTLYGTTAGNSLGVFGHVGSLFKVNTDSSGFTHLYDFNASDNNSMPMASLVLLRNTLYGTTHGAPGSSGAIFAINTDGTGFKYLYQFSALASPSFQNNDGANPFAGFLLSGSYLYGTARNGGASANGTVFKFSLNGQGFTTLYSFSGPFQSDPFVLVTNNDGALPIAGLVLLGNTLYGTTTQGGTGGNGTVFAINTDGSGFTNLHSFAPVDATTGANGDGANPAATLILSASTLYGTAVAGGSSSNGTVFKLNSDGSGFTVLHSFAPTMGFNANNALTNTDGSAPLSRLVLSGNYLYGTASQGGSLGNGTVFGLSIDGPDFKVLRTFLGQGDGTTPSSGLILSGSSLYGGLAKGGQSGSSAVYGLSFVAPLLSITLQPPEAILTWPVTSAGFSFSGYFLESTTNLASPIWTTNLPAPVIINGQYTVPVPISDSQEYFRLSQ